MQKTVATIAPRASSGQTLRVAAYCRVSSDSSDQRHSFAAQVQYYTKSISENERMELVDIYADEGITGTKTAKRDDFNRMVTDCKKGKIDRILTKSVSRFARNTADALTYARLLKEYGVSILFEKENIDTAYMSSELLLALSGAQAQEESISISKNMRWSIERRMKNGTFIASHTPYGYKLFKNEFVIEEKEAKIVQLIFQSFLSGKGKKAIADMLNKMKIPTRNVGCQWQTSTVGYILENERYIGDAIFQKTFTTETLPFINKENRGEKNKYYVENANPPIISEEVFSATQKLIQKNKKVKRKDIVVRPLTKKIYCNCGGVYKPRTIKDRTYWECAKHNVDTNICDSRRIPEKDIYEAFITVVNKLRNCKDALISSAVAQVERLQMKAGGTAMRISEIDREVADLNNKNLVLARLNIKGILRPDEYMEQTGIVNNRVNTLCAERRRLLHEQDEDNILSGLRKLNDLLTDIKNPVTKFDAKLFGCMVEKIAIPTETSLCFQLIGGLKITEEIPSRKRGRKE